MYNSALTNILVIPLFAITNSSKTNPSKHKKIQHPNIQLPATTAYTASLTNIIHTPVVPSPIPPQLNFSGTAGRELRLPYYDYKVSVGRIAGKSGADPPTALFQARAAVELFRRFRFPERKPKIELPRRRRRRHRPRAIYFARKVSRGTYVWVRVEAGRVKLGATMVSCRVEFVEHWTVGMVFELDKVKDLSECCEMS